MIRRTCLPSTRQRDTSRISLQLPPGATQAAGTSQDAAVDSNDEGEAEPAAEPQVMEMGPNKGFVSHSDVLALQAWADRAGCLDIFNDMTHAITINNGVMSMLPRQYKSILHAVHGMRNA
jgi:hypothetical protein